MSDAHIPTKEELLSEGSSLEQKLLSEIQAARRLRIKWYDIRRSQLNPFAERQEVSRKGIHQYQHDYSRLLPSLPADVNTDIFKSQWSTQRDELKSLQHEFSLALADAKSEADNRIMRSLTVTALGVSVFALFLVMVQIRMANDQDAIVKAQLGTMQAQHEVMKTQDARLKDQTVMMEQQNKLLGEQVTVMQRQFSILEKQDKSNTRLSLKKPNLLVEYKAHETLVADSGSAPKPRYDLQFTVFNSGDKSTRNYAVFLFVPLGVETVMNHPFARSSDNVKIDGRDYYYFTLYMRDPVAPQQRVYLGNLSFQGPLHEFAIPWKVETEDDGVFPSKGKLGQLDIPIRTP